MKASRYTSYSQTMRQPEGRVSASSQMILGAVCAGLIITSGQSLLMTASLLVLAVGGYLLWTPGLAPVLLFAFFYQWAQVSGKLFYSLIFQTPLSSRVVQTEYFREAISLGLVGLVVLALGMWALSRLLQANNIRQLIQKEAKSINIKYVFWVYIAMVAYMIVRPVLVQVIPPARQIFIGIEALRWAVVFLIGYVALNNKEGYVLVSIIVIVEIIYGIGYFAGFKTVFFVLAIVVGALYESIDTSAIVIGGAIFAFIFLVGSAWSSVERDYREFLNQGTDRQVVMVSKWKQVSKLAKLVSSLSTEEIVRGAEGTISRISQVEKFAATLDHVPDRRPHEGGKLWGKAVKHILKPRIFFPNKEPITPASLKTRKYTGLHVAGPEQGTAVVMGYMAESYVDFGKYGMFFPVLLLGMAWGGIFVYLIRTSRTKIIGLSFAVAVLISANQFEITSSKLLGSVLIRFIMAVVATKITDRYIVPYIFDD